MPASFFTNTHKSGLNPFEQRICPHLWIFGAKTISKMHKKLVKNVLKIFQKCIEIYL